jgi:hypothetical protein
MEFLAEKLGREVVDAVFSPQSLLSLGYKDG